MSKHTLAIGLIAALTGAGCMANVDDTGRSTQAMEEGDGDHGGGHSGHCEAAPVMLSGDFDGDGTVTPDDLTMLNDFRESGDYAAYFDLDADGDLDGRDVAILARNMGDEAHPRDAQMAELWATTAPYRNIGAAYAAGYVPFTPDLQGHGIHFANFDLVYSWPDRGFQASAPEGLNYAADGTLLAAFYYAPGAADLAEVAPHVPPGQYYFRIPLGPTFADMPLSAWHNHTGACFGGATSPVPGFDQCMTEAECAAVGGTLWSDVFHMLHVWMFEYNECGPFAGVDPDVSPHAPEEPSHMACTLEDIVPNVVPYPGT